MPSTSKTANLLLMSLEDNEIYTVSRDNENWYIDNGATSHVTNRADIFQTYEHFNENFTATTAAGKVRPEGKGTVQLRGYVNGKQIDMSLQDVWYIPTISKNLFSVLALHDQFRIAFFHPGQLNATSLSTGKYA